MSSKIPLSTPFVCRKSVPLIPNLTPVISNLSIDSSKIGMYTVVTIYGNNFSLSGITGRSVVNFVSSYNNSYRNLQVTFYSSQEISFTVPTNATVGDYLISVVNAQYPLALTSNFVNYTIVS
jgi:hypothetical protein